MRLELGRAVGRQPLAHEGAERFADLVRVLLVDQAERDLRRCLGGDHRLEALAGVAADDAVELGGRPRPDQFQHRAALLAGRHRKADLAEEALGGLAERVPCLLDLRGRLLDAVIEAGNGDAAIVVVDRRQDLCQHADRVGGSAAELARMQVAVGRLDRHLLADQAAQADADRRRIAVPHAGVADQRELGLQLLGIGLEERLQRRRAGFLLALEQDRHLAGQLAVHVLVGAAGFDEGHQLALVVGRAARRRSPSGHCRRYRSTARTDRPSRARAGRPAARRSGRRTAHAGRRRRDGRPPSDGRACRAPRPRSRSTVQIGDEPFGGAAAFRGIGGIGRDRFDAQQPEQPLQAAVEIGVEMVKHRGESGHGRFLSNRRNPNGAEQKRKDRERWTSAGNKTKKAAVAEGGYHGGATQNAATRRGG